MSKPLLKEKRMSSGEIIVGLRKAGSDIRWRAAERIEELEFELAELGRKTLGWDELTMKLFKRTATRALQPGAEEAFSRQPWNFLKIALWHRIERHWKERKSHFARALIAQERKP